MSEGALRPHTVWAALLVAFCVMGWVLSTGEIQLHGPDGHTVLVLAVGLTLGQCSYGFIIWQVTRRKESMWVAASHVISSCGMLALMPVDAGVVGWVAPWALSGNKVFVFVAVAMLLSGVLCHFAWMNALSDVHIGARRVRTNLPLVNELEETLLHQDLDPSVAHMHAVEALRKQAGFLATMSHELRTPVSGIVGLSRMLATGTLHPDRLRKELGTIERLALQLLRTVDEGLAFVRNEVEHRGAQNRAVRMDHLVHDLRVLSAWLAQQRGNIFLLSEEGEIPSLLLFDEQRMRQVLVNLITNAARYCSDGRIHLSVAYLQAAGCWPTLVWIVEDNGRGMSEAERSRYREAYTKSPDSIGLGLGLSLVRQLVDEMGGQMELSSKPGKGTRVSVSIPVTPCTGGCAEAGSAQKQPTKDLSPQILQYCVQAPGGSFQLLQTNQLRLHLQRGQLSELETWIERAWKIEGLSLAERGVLDHMSRAIEQIDLPLLQAILDELEAPAG